MKRKYIETVRLKRKSTREILRQQLELLAEESKKTYPASNELSQNSLAMVAIGNALLKRKCFTIVFAVTFTYFIMSIAKHGK